MRRIKIILALSVLLFTVPFGRSGSGVHAEPPLDDAYYWPEDVEKVAKELAKEIAEDKKNAESVEPILDNTPSDQPSPAEPVAMEYVLVQDTTITVKINR